MFCADRCHGPPQAIAQGIWILDDHTGAGRSCGGDSLHHRACQGADGRHNGNLPSGTLAGVDWSKFFVEAVHGVRVSWHGAVGTELAGGIGNGDADSFGVDIQADLFDDPSCG